MTHWQELLHQIHNWLDTGQWERALAVLAQEGARATTTEDWPVAIETHRLTAELLHRLGQWGPALSHAAEGLYLCLEHHPEGVLDSLGQILAFVEEAVAQRWYLVAEEVGPGLLAVLDTLRPAPGAESWLTLATDIARLIALIGEAHGQADHPAYAEAAALAALVDRATQGTLNLSRWVHSTVFDGPTSPARAE